MRYPKTSMHPKTSTCPCGKIDLQIQLDKNQRSFIKCNICSKKTYDPVPDNFTNQSQLTNFYPKTKKRKIAFFPQHVPVRLKQTKLKKI